MAYAPHAGPKPSTKRQDRSVTFVFRETSSQHCAGINAIAVSADAALLWTASRDSVVKKWDISGRQRHQPQLQTNYEGHIDWVNAITLVNQGDTLVSCSADESLRVWSARDSAASCAAVLCQHTDYVTSLAASTVRPVVSSGGLGGEVFLWDLEAAQVSGGGSLSGAKNAAVSGIGRVDGLACSVYSMAMDASGNVIAAGTSDGSIWVIDTRSGRAEGVLRGHGGNVRSLWMRPDGGLLLSGSADHTIRSWDMRQCRSTTTLAVHASSVWCLAPLTPDGLHVLSGGREGCVYLTDLTTRTSRVVLEEPYPITSVVPVPSGQRIGRKEEPSLWVATTSSTVHCWVPSPGAGDDDSNSFVAGSLSSVRSRMIFDESTGATRPPPRPATLVAEIPGAAPIRRIAILTNRRHVLTQDTDHRVKLWDISVGAPVKDMGTMESLGDAERELFDPAQSVAVWFRPDLRLGCLAGTMEARECFSAEAYRRDLGDESAAADAKINMAQHMLGALFAQWALRRTGDRGNMDSASKEGRVMMEDVTEDEKRDVSASHIPGSSLPDADEQVAIAVAVAPATGPLGGKDSTAFALRPRLPPVVMISGAEGQPPWRRDTDKFDGTEAEGEGIPQWVADCVLRRRFPMGKDLKMAFILVPAPGSGLPSLLQSRLNAPRVLGIDKVADYVLRKMADQGIVLAEEPLFWSPEKQALWQAEHGGDRMEEDAVASQGRSPALHDSASGTGVVGNALGMLGVRQLRPLAGSAAGTVSATSRPLLITCGGAAVPWDFTLAAVRQWMWKRSEDLRLEYTIRQPGTELRPPVIRPPS